jgi:diguanylate cyclase (GGDEF)-like protein/PAS domain S-box-containing protein
VFRDGRCVTSLPAPSKNAFGDANISASLQAKLENSERMLNSLMCNLNGLVYCCLYDVKWTMVFIGGDCKRLTGYDAASMLSNPIVYWEDLTHPADREWVRKKIDMAVSTGQRFVAEYRIVDANGEIKWVSERGCPVYNEQGEIEAIEGFLQNISRLKFSELAANAAEERFRSIFENAIDGIYQTSVDGIYLNANPALAKIYGYDSPADLVQGISNIDNQLYVDHGKRDEFVALMSLHGQVTSFEARVHRKHGEVIWISESAREVRDSDGNLMYYEGIVKDITVHKTMETDLHISATAFETHESLMITDINNVILRVNKAFADSTGYTAEEAVGQTPRILKSGRHTEEFYREMWRAIHQTGAWQGEIWDRRKNGDIYPTWLTISAVKGANGVVTHYVGSHIDITERKAAEKKIQHLAFYDALTRLPNRRLLMDRLQHALVSSSRIDREGALLFIDLDNFKTLNDTLGHGIGDLLLQQVALRLESCVRENDTVARLGGDEFVVLLEGLSEQALEAAAQTEAIGEKILAALNLPYLLAEHEYHCTASIGATVFNGNAHAIDDLMKQADIAMYQSKKAGRNTLRFFDLQMQMSIAARASLENELRKALENQEFHLYYQIQVDSSHRPLGAEALIRWIHPERGLVPPAHFIPLVEETELILPIGKWVLETACAQIKAWQQNVLTRDLTLAVNVSAKQFKQADFAVQVQAAVKRHGINPMLLKLELTEGLLLESIEDTIETMNTLNKIGVRLSLDDFGTGYSSLQYLKRLPLDQLKIDQSFVCDLTCDSSDEAIVGTIIAIAHSLNMDVIAEGVETEEQRQLLLNKGCTHYQGYLFGKPVPIDQFELHLKQG